MMSVVININKVIIRDVNLSLNVKKFVEKFIKINIIFLINFFLMIIK